MKEALAIPSRGLWTDAAFFVAIMATTLALGGALAHAYELINKIEMPRDSYFITQRAYDGWNQLAYVLVVQLSAIIAVMILHRREPSVFWLATVALVCLVAAQIVFWIWTYPANVATDQWTTMPQDWEALRTQWEYSHLVGAGFQLLVMTALVVSLLRRRH